MMRSKFLFAFVVLIFSSLACSLSRETEVLFEDDFSDEDSGWDIVSDEIGITDYLDGEYRIRVDATQYDIWAYPYQEFSDVDITVEARKEAGTDDNNFGIVCRAESNLSFYTGMICSDGYYAIQKVVSGEYVRLSSDYFEYSDVINQGNATNTIRLTCVGDSITLYANGVELATVQDSEIQTGDIGLIAGTYEEAGVDIRSLTTSSQKSHNVKPSLN